MRPRDPSKLEKIRRHALEMLVLEGFDVFSMQKLAKAAGVSPATLYIYYADKEDLIFQLWRDEVEALAEALLEGFDPEAPFEQELWRQWIRRVTFFEQHPLEWRFIEQVMHSPLHEKYMDRAPARIGEVMGPFVVRAIERGELTTFDLGQDWQDIFPKEVFWSLAYGPLYSILSWASDRSEPLNPDSVKVDRKVLEKAFACVVKGLRP